MVIALLVRSPIFWYHFAPFWVRFAPLKRLLRTPFARPLRPLCTGVAPLTKIQTENIYLRETAILDKTSKTELKMQY